MFKTLVRSTAAAWLPVVVTPLPLRKKGPHLHLKFDRIAAAVAIQLKPEPSRVLIHCFYIYRETLQSVCRELSSELFKRLLTSAPFGTHRSQLVSKGRLQ